ncbi:MAG: ATP-dependent Clp protease ATP-binding subunit [Verrucomicrobiales bacterium]|nr:ATP-dependent Clp protease ATP-binding subunit [Verrucomicrobiales bacterium]
MITQKYPVLLWSDAAGGTTAALVGDVEGAAAHASSASLALAQLKELLAWREENEPWNLDPELEEGSLLEVKVEVRPQYRSGHRMIPCPETVWLRVPCVIGRQTSGLRLCVVPHLQVQFNYQSAADLRGLVAHYVKDALQGASPEVLAASLPPRECRLEELSHRVERDRTRRVVPEQRSELKVLFAVADPLLHDQGRKRVVSAAYGRESLAESLARRLAREKASVLLVGESGVGKTTLLLDAAKRLARLGDAPGDAGVDAEGPASDRDLRTYRFWRGSGARLIAGMRYLGEWEARCESFIHQLHAIGGIFCAENLLELLRVGGEGPGDSVGAFLLPFLHRAELRMVAEATPAEVLACRRLLPGLLDAFQVVEVPALDVATAEQVLQRIVATHATGSRLQVAPGVASLVCRLFRRFQPYAHFPGPAAALARRLGEKREGGSVAETGEITRERVISRFAALTGLPEVFLRDDLMLPVEEVRQFLARRIVGQPDAVSAGTRLIAAIKTGLTDPGRPLGVLLFCGPTGVGKTAMAKALVEFCFGAGGAKDRLVRLDMSEYGGWGASQRLLRGSGGAPAEWILRVRRQPFCVVLFDEIEKAAPEVFDVLLSLIDEGRFTDPLGRVTWFRSAIVLLTSNLAANTSALTGFGPEASPADDSEVSKFFRPEFFNRLDGVIRFQALRPADVEEIARKELNELASREGLASGNLQMVWSESLVAMLAREGYDPRLGARPLQRVIETRVAVPLARWRVANPRVRDVRLILELDGNGQVTVRQES